MPDNHYLLKPVSAQLKAEVDSEKVKFERPRIRLEISFEAIEFAFDRQQYRRVLAIGDTFSLHTKRTKYLDLLPENPTRPADDPRSWFVFQIYETYFLGGILPSTPLCVMFVQRMHNGNGRQFDNAKLIAMII